MRTIISAIVLVLLAAGQVDAQRRKPQPKRPAPKETAKPPASKMVGSQVVITTKSGAIIRGQFVDLNSYSIRIRSDNLESTIALETIGGISFGNTPLATSQPVKQSSPPSAEMAQDLDPVLKSVDTISSATRTGTDYTEYGRLLTDLRRQAERFIDKFSDSENPTETRAVALLSGALTDYTWARTIWTLKLGRSSEGLVSESDSPVISDALALYPQLRNTAASGNKLSGDKLIGGLWKEASAKVDMVRALLKITGQ